MRTAQHLQLSVHTLFAIFSPKLHPLDSKTGANQCVLNTLQCIHFHLQLPPFRAALVPSWAMAPRSAPAAFSRRILTSLHRFSWVSSDVVSVSPPPLLSSAARRGCKRKSSFARVLSPGRFFFTIGASLLGGEDAHAWGVEEGGRCKSFTNNCNPLVRLRRRTVTCARLFGSDNPSGRRQTQTSSVLLPGVYARWNTQDSALTRERCPPKAARSLDRAAQESECQPKGGSARVPCCLRNRRRIRSSFLRLCLRVSLSLQDKTWLRPPASPEHGVCDARRGPQCGSCSTRESERAPTRAIIGRLQQDFNPAPFFFLFFFFFWSAQVRSRHHPAERGTANT